MSTFRYIQLFPFLALAYSFLATASPLSSRSTTYYGLIFAQNSGCSPDQTTQVLNAITDMRILSTSALSALQNTNSPSSYFFSSSYFSTASAVFNATLFETQPLQDLPTDASLGTQIQLFCANDTDSTCNTLSPGNNYVSDKSSRTTTWGYVNPNANPVFGEGGAAQIFACPALLNGSLPRDASACTGTPGEATLGWAFLRTFVQLKTLQIVPKLGKNRDVISDAAPGVAQSHELVVSKGQYSLNADNYAELALWASNLGASGNAAQPFQCAQNWPFS